MIDEKDSMIDEKGHERFHISRSQDRRPSVWRGILGGMFGGFMIGVLRYVYEQHTHPSTYNAIDLYLGTPVFMVVGVLIGLLIMAWLAAD
jgi:predicted lipid-binding transport protein (Tim44 family)